jgi:hypothetical protein
VPVPLIVNRSEFPSGSNLREDGAMTKRTALFSPEMREASADFARAEPAAIAILHALLGARRAGAMA